MHNGPFLALGYVTFLKSQVNFIQWVITVHHDTFHMEQVKWSRLVLFPLCSARWLNL